MRTFAFIIFLGVFFALYAAASYYLYVRGVQAFSMQYPQKRWFAILFFTISFSFFAGFLLEHVASSAFSEWVFRIGTFWLPVMLYLLMAVVLVDMVRLFDHFFHFLPAETKTLKLIVGTVVVSIVGVVVLAGYINALTINVKNIPLTIHKKVDGKNEMRVLMASDIHLGALIGDNREKKFLDIVEKQKPDIVLLCGDLIDSEIAPVLRKNLGKHIQEIKTPMGVYAITGNHEYIGGISKTLPYLRSIHINMLIDSVVTLPNGVQLVGRNDRAANGMRNNGQKPLSELMKDVDLSRPVIIMNHQPYNLDEAVTAGADLHLSGHTHHGQIWPLNYVTKAIFEVSWGYKKKEDTHFYVSSGFGTWGPLVRLGNRPEVVVFDLKFDE